MKIDVKSAIVDILKREGITHVFGHTGSHVIPLWEAVNNGGLNIIFNKQEGNATYMADGYARIAKKPSIVLGTLGPGVTNMVTGLTTAFMDSIPVIAIGGTVNGHESGRNSMQETSGRGRSPEQRMIFKACCKQAMFAPSAQDTPNVIREAFRVANSGRKGPVYVEIPNDYLNTVIDYEPLATFQYQNKNIPSCNINDVKQIETELFKASHPLIMIGEGAEEENIRELLSGFLKELNIPYTTTPQAKNFVDEFDSLYLGSARGSGKTQKAYEYMKKSDFILFLGARMHRPEMSWDNRAILGEAKLAQVDFDEDEIGRVYPIHYSAVGSVSSFIKNIHAKKHDKSTVLTAEVAQLNITFPRLDKYMDSEIGINPLSIINMVEKSADKDAVIVADTGYVKATAILKYRRSKEQTFVISDKNGAMGYSLPAAIGARLASEKETVCFVGDGGIQMSLNELGTAMNYDLKVIYVIFNNGGCISVKDFHTFLFGHYSPSLFKNPEFKKIAEAYGMNGVQVKTSKEFEKAFGDAKKSTKSTIIDVLVDQSLMVWE
jgi:acetolactate synthase-1/2/3 large subunit